MIKAPQERRTWQRQIRHGVQSPLCTSLDLARDSKASTSAAQRWQEFESQKQNSVSRRSWTPRVSQQSLTSTAVSSIQSDEHHEHFLVQRPSDSGFTSKTRTRSKSFYRFLFPSRHQNQSFLTSHHLELPESYA